MGAKTTDYVAAVKTAACYLERYPQLKQELAERRAEIEERGLQEAYAVARPAGDPGDPTAKRVVELSKLHRTEAWVRVIERDFLPGLDETERRILELRWKLGRGTRGRPVWPRVAWELHFCETHIKRTWAALAARLAWHAAQAGLYDDWRPRGGRGDSARNKP